jgi:outer membrane protein OmpA-like peptidoglycan-associated protein
MMFNMRNLFVFVLSLLIFSSGINSAWAQDKQDSVIVTRVHMGKEINSPFPDYAPVISADGLMMLFTSRRPVTEKEIKKGKIGKEHIYVSYRDSSNGDWKNAVMMKEPVNMRGRNNSAIALSNDGQHMLLYRDSTDGNGDIYESFLKGTEWSEPRKMPEPINSDSHESSASIAPDGKTIYFVSERRGGMGGRDIWFSTQDSTGKWGPAKNMGPVINTKEDEEGVYIHPDGKTLYFSSKGHHSMGGYDVFKSVYENEKWGDPVSLGSVINTAGDDIFCVIAADGKKGYYTSSWLNGVGETDVYEISFTRYAPPLLTLVKGIVTDDRTLQPIGSTIRVYDNSTGKLLSTLESNSATGNFLVSLQSGKSYRIEATAEGYFPYTHVIDIPKGETYKELNLAIKLKSKNPMTVVTGKVVDEEGHSLVAMIEVINNASNEMLGKSNSGTEGDFHSVLQPGKTYGLTVSAEGYLFQSVNLDIPAGTDSLNLKVIVLKRIQKGKNIVLNNVFFDFDKATLRPDSKPELDRVVKVLKDNPSMKIEISGHTDNKGSASYNLKLSEARAKSVVEYLHANGTDLSRLTYKGYGFAKPIATNETEEGRQLNRRTEFKVLDIDEKARPIVRAETPSSNAVTVAPVVKTTPDSDSKIPAELRSADTNKDGTISYAEIANTINGFFDGTGDFTIEKINVLIDFFFEQAQLSKSR